MSETQSNSTSQEPLYIGSDFAVEDPDSDAYGYAPFAKLIANAVWTTPSPRGLVMAIHGSWGSGKSTLLNFVKFYLSELPEDERPVTIDFNPWWFDDRNHLAAQFMAQFKSRLPSESKVLRGIGNVMAEYSEALRKTVAVGYGIPLLDKPVSFLLKKLGSGPKGGVPQLKKEISDALKKEGQRFLFVIDDIDRLAPDEMKELFKVIKALADFPNVIYILAFDRKVVAEALKVSMAVDGDVYLEKIVQVPFVLPSVDPLRLRNKLFADLGRLLTGSDLSLFDQTYFGNVFNEGVLPSIRKPRDVVRYVNTLSVTFPAVRDEVNPTDFFALEFVRMRLPKLYDAMRDNPGMFAGYSDRGLAAVERKGESEFHERWAAEVDSDIRDGVLAMMERIFPKLGSMGHASEFLTEWRRGLKAAHPDVLPIYFRFAVDADRLSRRTMGDFVRNLDNGKATEETLLTAAAKRLADGTSRVKDYLDQLHDFTELIDETKARTLLEVLGRIGDRLFIPEDEAQGFISVRSSWRLAWAMQNALGRLSDDRRDDILIAASAGGEALTYLCVAIQTVEGALEKPMDNGPSAPLSRMKNDTVVALKDIALSRIREFAADDRLPDTPEFPSVLLSWRDWAGIKEPAAWVSAAVNDPDRLFRILGKFLTSIKSQTVGDSVGRSRSTLVLKTLAAFVELASVEQTLSKVGNNDLGDSGRREIMDTFYRQYPVFKEGKDPDSPWALMGVD